MTDWYIKLIQKAVKVINSCKTLEQIDYAARYLYLVKKELKKDKYFETDLKFLYNQLELFLQRKRLELGRV